MKNKVKLISLVMGIFILFLATVVLAEDFSADMINTTKDGIFKGKIFITKDKTRMEVPGSITITRIDKKVVWILMPKDKMYMEQPFDPGKVVATSEKISGEIERKLIGQEIIDGRMTNKYQIVYNQDGKRETIFQWIAVGLNIPVKIAAGDNSWTMEYKNIKIGKQSDALFEVPADYQKFSYQMPSMKDILEGFGE
jgi:hypothetical protein